ncbi:hypothetical protein NDS46_31630 (plasmid) [Paenibacillus thiaminolyticus]|uniref:hypothetical protein n=1 Tax=Paenibacillus thiaminolyticus TaxID=49283 RepID=UPI00232CEBE5|nr:hypothetical protein [Paenibacillus thiaminolyticus]WCF11510.1 hypothetical protein NDS46_31630 [Paenibacillus thiaminolyticus]
MESDAFDYNLFAEYLDHLQKHLFGELSFEEILNNIENNHRKIRFVSMYILKDKELFYELFKKRKERGLEDIFNSVIGTLLCESDNPEFKTVFIRNLNLCSGMLSEEVSEFKRKVVMKDLQAFMLWAWKQDPQRTTPPWEQGMNKKD